MILTDDEKQILDDNLSEIIEYTYAMSAFTIWSYIESPTLNIEHKQEAFLYVLKQLLIQGKVKIGRKHRLLDMPIEELLQKFRDSWPSDEEFDEDHFSTVQPYPVKGKKLLHSHYWTPGDLVWIDPNDGEEVWSTEANH